VTPREQVMATVRRSLGVTGEERPRRKIVEDRLAGRPRGLLPARALGKSKVELVALFVEMAEASAATVATVRSADQVPAAVADFLRGRNLALRLRRGEDARLSGLPWDRAAIEVATGRSHGDDETGVSAAFAGVAETGTLVLLSGPENPTTLNFLPDNHVVVVDAADLSATYEDAWSRIRDRHGDATMPRAVNWITGPSRSADIEQILLMGAHGPRRLHIVLIDPSADAAALAAEAAPAGSTPSPSEIRSTIAAGDGDRNDKPKPEPSKTPEKEKKPEPEEGDDGLDEELEESFPASDPPSRTQP
jgi:L-lactate dehydrogenase complex protein LldG